VLALGAWLKNTACLAQWDADRATPKLVWSESHGYLSDPDACRALEASAQALLAQAGPEGVAAITHDLHPDFFSTQLAVRLASQLGVPAIGVQHHHAHVAAVMATDPWNDGEPVLGLALDGVGLGTDGTAWGGELLAVQGTGGHGQWQRMGHLRALPLPGGDRAAREPWRMLASVFHISEQQTNIYKALEANFPSKLSATQVQTVVQMLARSLNCPLTTSAGRWFDAAAAALGLCGWQHDEAEAARALEQAATAALGVQPDLPPLDGAHWQQGPDGPDVLDLAPLVLHLCTVDPTDIAAVQRAAAGFHLALADALVAGVQRARARWPGPGPAPTRVALSGGCFFNTLLRERVQQGLHQVGLSTALPAHHGCGDAGLALGQAWVAWQQLTADPNPVPRIHPLPEELQSCA
jgi:hydrogenase maturation protein HypF